MCFIRLFSEVRVSIDKEYNCKSASKNPVQYFNIIMDVSSLCYKMVIFKRVWFNQEDYLHVLLYIQGKNHLRVKPSSVQVIFQKNISKFCKYKYTYIFLNFSYFKRSSSSSHFSVVSPPTHLPASFLEKTLSTRVALGHFHYGLIN